MASRRLHDAAVAGRQADEVDEAPAERTSWLPNTALTNQPAMTALHSNGQALPNAEVARALSTPAMAGSAAEQAADRVADIAAADTSVPAGERSAVQHLAPLLGHDFGGVRVHRDAEAADRAEVLQARAFTVGQDVYMGRNEPGPATAAGRHLLAHELSHVVQQRSGTAVQRQAIPQDLQSSPHLRGMTDDALKLRHDRILGVLDQFTVSTPETALLEQQVADIGTELARRTALAAGRTFEQTEIDKAKEYFVQNSRTEKDSCIVALNKGLKLFTGNPSLASTPKSIEATMAKVSAEGYAGDAHEIWFQTAGGRITHGSARPEQLAGSVWGSLITMSAGDPGWSVFTMSLLDGYHSITLTLDASDPSHPHVYWSDQWQSKGGWKEYTKSALDAEVTKLVQGWWDGQAEGRKHTTVVRLWRMRSKPDTAAP